MERFLSQVPLVAIVRRVKGGDAPAERVLSGPPKVLFVVGHQKFDTESAAQGALADASESYVKKFVRIACVVDGKVVYCDTDCTGAKGRDGKITKAASTCGTKAKLAKADGKDCCKAAQKAKLAKADGKSSCQTAQKAKLAKADGQTCGQTAQKAKLAKADGKSSCQAAQTAKLAKADGKTCSKAAQKAKLAKADGKACCKAGSKAKLAKADCEARCKEAKNVKFLVAGQQFDRWEAAVKARDEAVAAVKRVRMTFVVDGKKVDCCSKVCPKAKKAGKVKFVVSENEMDDETEARVALARAQYEAAKNACNKLLAKI